ncbi:hypothetical protein GCM10023144_33620 [Pigmentiphaga soli]|uniref:Putative regulatory protein FmdB zinc ribbon domain-containing protein n=1 Tax=Pigmentiphaga soli TaxID=1007095 RepID=A0ABP8HDI9_9BURK
MPIYAYKCTACGFEKDVLQKMSDAPLTECPSCGQSTFAKQLTAAGFQLKGSGWYVTDFRNGGSGAKPAAASSGSPEGRAKPAEGGAKPAGDGAASSAGSSPESSGASKAASTPPAAA